MNATLQNKLKSVEWKEFKIGSIFEIKRGKRLVKQEQQPGKVPYISSTAENNGIDNFITPPDYMEIHSHCLTIANSGSVGATFYHPYKFVASDHVTVLKNENLNEHTGQFIIPILNRLKDKYSFNRELNNTRLKNETIILPVNKNGEPDWSSMEDFMKQVEQEVKPELNFIPHEIKDHRELSELEWGEFKIEDIFHVKSGKRLTKKEMKNGKIPFVGSTNRNNGITNFVSNQNNSMDSNVLGVNYNGSVVENFYHPYKCIFSDDVKRLSLKGMVGNKYIYLFIKTMILMQKKKYAYGYKFNGQRMQRQVILLPVTEKGQPDWNFMEQYMKRMENEILSQKEIQ